MDWRLTLVANLPPNFLPKRYGNSFLDGNAQSIQDGSRFPKKIIDMSEKIRVYSSKRV
jgi:hypothetical protein